MCLNYKEKYQTLCGETARYKKKYDLMYQWMKLKQKGIELFEFFKNRNITSAAIYGMGDLGQLIYKEPGMENITKYAIDRQADPKLNGLPVYTLENVPEKVDAILITPVLITDEIENQIFDILGEQTTFVFEEILFELSRKYDIKSDLWPI